MSSSKGYIMDLRKIVGTRPLIMSGACVLLVQNSRLLLERRTDNGMWGLPEGSLEPGESMEQVNGDEVYNVVAAYICKQEYIKRI